MEEKDVRDAIGRLESLAKLSVKDFAKDGGYADTLAHGWQRNLRASQLRKFFGAVKDIEKRLEDGSSWSDVEGDFYLLQPQVAYAYARDVVPGGFLEVIKICMTKIDVGGEEEKKKNYKRFVQFLEAIVAYHKYYNPKGGI